MNSVRHENFIVSGFCVCGGDSWCGFIGERSGRTEKPIRKKQSKLRIYWLNTVAWKLRVSVFHVRGSLHVT